MLYTQGSGPIRARVRARARARARDRAWLSVSLWSVQESHPLCMTTYLAEHKYWPEPTHRPNPKSISNPKPMPKLKPSVPKRRICNPTHWLLGSSKCDRPAEAQISCHVMMADFSEFLLEWACTGHYATPQHNPHSYTGTAGVLKSPGSGQMKPARCAGPPPCASPEQIKIEAGGCAGGWRPCARWRVAGLGRKAAGRVGLEMQKPTAIPIASRTVIAAVDGRLWLSTGRRLSPVIGSAALIDAE